MPTAAQIREAVTHYLKTVADGTPDEIAACYAPDATLEDPVGSAPVRGREAIARFYGAAPGGGRRSAQLLALRVAGDTAAFHFLVRTELSGAIVEVAPIDVMTFDESARITSMRAFWGDGDLHAGPRGGSHEDSRQTVSVGMDRQAITDVVNQYAYALDIRDWAALDDVFTADAVVRYGGPDSPPLEGRQAVITAIRSSLGGCGPCQHLLGNHLVDVQGDRAVAVCKARVFHYGAGPRAELIPYECFGVYRDRLRRTPEGWRIEERTFEIHLATGDQDVLQPA
jgi:ketosteroid isomerase-like protein